MDKSKFQQLSVSTTSSFHPSSRWEKVVIPGPLPPRRSCHSAVANENQLMVFGGQDLADGLLSDLWRLSLKLDDEEEDLWQRLEPTGVAPGVLCRHKAILHGTSMYIIGGTDNSSENKTLYALDLKRMHWTAYPEATPAIDSHSAVLPTRQLTV